MTAWRTLLFNSPAAQRAIGIRGSASKRPALDRSSGSLSLVDAASRFVAVFTACLAATHVGLALTVTTEVRPISVLWPPNAVLLVAFTVTPYGRWWICASAAAAAAVAGRWDQPYPILLTLRMFAENAAQAATAAIALRLFRPDGIRFDRLNDVFLFILCAAVAAPFSTRLLTAPSDVAAFLIATNLITTLALAPALLGWHDAIRNKLPKLSRARKHEGAWFLLSAVAVVLLTFGGSLPPGIPPLTAGYLLIPNLIWSALRLGPLATHTFIFVVAVAANLSAVQGRFAVAGFGSLESALSLQLFLGFLTAPILCLTAAIQDRERALAVTRGLQARIATVQEEERARIAQDLHDDINQRLACVGLSLSQLQRCFPDDDPRISDRLQKLHHQVTDIVHAVRGVAHQLHPSALSRGGLGPALERLCADFSAAAGVRVDCRADGAAQADGAIAICLYRITQEALQNVAKHSRATSVLVRLERAQSGLLLSIRDDGVGCSSRPSEGGLGFEGMRLRAAALEGSVHVRSDSGKGTEILVLLPSRCAARAS